MTARAAIPQSDLVRAFRAAAKAGVSIEVKIGEAVIRTIPDTSAQDTRPMDRAAEIDLG